MVTHLFHVWDYKGLTHRVAVRKTPFGMKLRNVRTYRCLVCGKECQRMGVAYWQSLEDIDADKILADLLASLKADERRAKLKALEAE